MEDHRIAVIGLGYVGLPLIVELAKHYDVVGFDNNKKRVNELNTGIDSTLEVDNSALKKLDIFFTSDSEDIINCDIYIVAVPTPIDIHKKPDMSFLLQASTLVGKLLKKGDFVFFESTVYPGATEEECGLILERESGLSINSDFYLGYSPERINPGDKEHGLKDIVKVVSGSNDYALEKCSEIYSSIITAGVYPVSSIKVAEAAKIIENTQRDLNIALINELAIIFNKLQIDTAEVISAAATKWNFIKFYPGMVGGHCIGVDPYYLTFKANELGYNPQIILSGRRLNDSMSLYICSQLVKLMSKKGMSIPGSKVLILGYTFKENCPDTRNTLVKQLVFELLDHSMSVDIYDPWVTSNKNKLNFIDKPKNESYDAIIIAVGHKHFIEMGIDKIKLLTRNKNSVIYDVKSIFDKESTDLRL